jgi:transposase
MKHKKPAILDVNMDQLEDILHRAEDSSLTEEDRNTIRVIFESYAYVLQLVDDKNTSLRRLRNLLFGASTEKTAVVTGDGEGTSSSSRDDASAASSDPADADASSESKTGAARKGHGRNGADAYRGANHVDVTHETLQAGDACLACEQGIVYETTCPGVLIRIKGQAPLHATVYELQKFRCGLCGKVFTAQAPKEAGTQKYDATAASMIALLKYGSGMPFNRLSGLQRNLEIPLPTSTQWDVVHAIAPTIAAAHEELIRQAAQGEVLHNDDTTVKILEVMRELAQTSADERDSSERTGMFTSGVIATREGNRIALFFSGRQHAGENLTDVLQHRAKELDPPIQMCDALSRNLPRELETIVANCLAHARRKFVDVYDRFPDECRHVLEALKVIYRNDAVTRKREMSPEKRLQFHRAKSQQTMDQLHRWLKQQFDKKLVEPNSALGDAINYMLNHWDKLTLFLRKAGAPLDNNICERALKKAILHRKNALFYRTENGARVGDMYMSLIHTCELCQVNPFDYLTELQRHADELNNDPESWMPWNYRTTLEANLVPA